MVRTSNGAELPARVLMPDPAIDVVLAKVETESVSHRVTSGVGAKNRSESKIFATLTYSTTLATLHKAQGRYAEAEPLHERSLAIPGETLGPDHPDVATSLENYAALLRKTGRADEATNAHMRAAVGSIPTFGADGIGIKCRK